MKLGVIGGAGLLGSTTAFYAGTQGIFSEIKLLDVKENVLRSHVMDMDQALLPLSDTRVTFADYSDLGDCDIILIAASLPERAVDNRNEYLQGNLKLVRTICENLKQYAKDKIIINTTNPIDVFNYAVWKLLDFPREKMIGFCINDTLRLKWALSKVRNVPYSDIDAIVLGEHGDGQVPVLSGVKIGGSPANLTADEIEKADTTIGNWFREYQALDSKRTTGWTSAINITKIMRCIVEESDEVLNCSAILDGQFGQKDVSIGVPVKLNKNGIASIESIDLADTEKAKFDKTSDHLRELIASIGF